MTTGKETVMRDEIEAALLEALLPEDRVWLRAHGWLEKPPPVAVQRSDEAVGPLIRQAATWSAAVITALVMAAHAIDGWWLHSDPTVDVWAVVDGGWWVLGVCVAAAVLSRWVRGRGSRVSGGRTAGEQG